MKNTAIERIITWSADGTARIELSTEEDYTIKYSETEMTSGTEGTEYTSAITLRNGETIYISLTDGRNYGDTGYRIRRGFYVL